MSRSCYRRSFSPSYLYRVSSGSLSPSLSLTSRTLLYAPVIKSSNNDSSDFLSPPSVRHYPAGGKAKELKTRITTIQSIVKVTASMKMIANAKLQKQQERLKNARKWHESTRSLLAHEYPPLDTADEFYLDKKTVQESEEVDSEIVIPITSDRGLCGGANSSIGKEVIRLLKLKPRAQLVLIGDKSVQQLQREYSKQFAMAISQVSGNKPITFHECCSIVDKLFLLSWDKVTFVHNYFQSIIAFRIRSFRFPSLKRFIEEEARHKPFEVADYDNILKSAYQYSLASILFGIMTEAQTCEIAARMTAMDNATTNGKELIKNLTLQYNKQRQSAITTELIEIVSGASAVDEQQKKKAEED